MVEEVDGVEGIGGESWNDVFKARETHDIQTSNIENTNATQEGTGIQELQATSDTSAIARQNVQNFLADTHSAITEASAHYGHSRNFINSKVESLNNTLDGMQSGQYSSNSNTTRMHITQAQKMLNAYNNEFGTKIKPLQTQVTNTISLATVQNDIKHLKSELHSIQELIKKEEANLSTDNSQLAAIKAQLNTATSWEHDLGSSLIQGLKDVLAVATCWIPGVDLLTASFAGQGEQTMELHDDDVKAMQNEITELTNASTDEGSALAKLRQMATQIEQLINTLENGCTSIMHDHLSPSDQSTTLKNLLTQFSSKTHDLAASAQIANQFINKAGVAKKLFEQIKAYAIIHDMIANYAIHGNLEDGADDDDTSYTTATGKTVSKHAGDKTAVSAHGGSNAASIIKSAIKAYEKKYCTGSSTLPTAESFLTKTLSVSADGTSVSPVDANFSESICGGLGGNSSEAFTSSGGFATADNGRTGWNGDSNWQGWGFHDNNGK